VLRIFLKLAHIKSGGAVKGNRDSVAKRLGVKRFTGGKVLSGHVLVRQRGTKIFAGVGCAMGGDNTIFAIRDGEVYFKTLKGKKIVCVK
jgi:large subunit ribosomal protein L27